MFLIINPRDFNKNYLMLSEKTKNNIMNDGFFYRLYYSDDCGTTKGLFLEFNLVNVSIDRYFNKLKCNFKKNDNTKIIRFIKTVEKLILNNVPDVEYKTPVYRIEEQLQNDFIKIFNNDTKNINEKKSINLLLKISGIWTNEKEYGVTFRFFLIRQ